MKNKLKIEIRLIWYFIESMYTKLLRLFHINKDKSIIPK